MRTNFLDLGSQNVLTVDDGDVLGYDSTLLIVLAQDLTGQSDCCRLFVTLC